MKRLKIVVTTLCLIASLAFVIPSSAYADDGDGPQGTKNSAPAPPPPPPPPDWSQVFWYLLRL